MADTGRSGFAGTSQHKTNEEFLDLDVQTGDQATVTWECDWADAVGLAQSKTQHPQYSWMKRKKATIERLDGLRAKVKVIFEGIQGSSYTSTEDTRAYSLEGTLSTEPIETHQDFDDFGGDVTTPNTTNGAKFDESSGAFLGFDGGGVASTSKLCKKGVRQYLCPSVVYSENRTIAHGTVPGGMANLGKLGKIDAPPNSSVKPDVGGRDWLLASLSIEAVGRGARISRSWRLSGPRGWDTDIYG